MPPATATLESDVLLRVRGVVQGVGFRPFVHRTASALHLRGWVRNDSQGVLIRAVGTSSDIESLLYSLRHEAPRAARVQSVEATPADQAASAPVGNEFVIVASENSAGATEAAVPPDLGLCAECRSELLDPSDRRHRYPFINCTQCGPRFSILESLPYDRPRTTMRGFRMCLECEREYQDPANRRFHAQPNACPVCGPQVRLIDAHGTDLAVGDEAVRLATLFLGNGQIVAVKGVGGYHLMVDATQESAVAELRRRKHRAEKPFAVMFRHLDALEKYADVPLEAAQLLMSPAAPIVLVRRYGDAALAPSVAPGNPWIGALLPYTALHVLLMDAVKHPVVATSANLAEEPLCADVEEAHAKLAGIADFYLDHDRPIANPIDDSVVRLAHDTPVILRRARGYAPVPLRLPAALDGHWLCTGAQMKGALAVAAGNRVVLSPHIGDLDGTATLDVYRRTAEVLRALHGEAFTAVACDKHPDYASTRIAREMGLPTVAVQHHLAHVLACLLENKRTADGVLGIAWDGTGYGEDGTVWGGEFILLEKNVARRFARVRPFRLAGGDAAVREPRRVALGLLHEMGDERFGELAADFELRSADAAVIAQMLSKGINSPVTSSAGRLFDAVGALLGLGLKNQFEGQTPLAVEAAAAVARGTHLALPLPLRDVAAGGGAVCELDWQPLVEKILSYRALGGEAGELAASFHHSLARAMVEVARRAGVGTVALTGGCFQNTLLLDLAVTELRSAGFTVLTHRELPPNDGSIAAGQALGALWNLTDVLLP